MAFLYFNRFPFAFRSAGNGKDKYRHFWEFTQYFIILLAFIK